MQTHKGGVAQNSCVKLYCMVCLSCHAIQSHSMSCYVKESVSLILLGEIEPEGGVGVRGGRVGIGPGDVGVRGVEVEGEREEGEEVDS